MRSVWFGPALSVLTIFAAACGGEAAPPPAAAPTSAAATASARAETQPTEVAPAPTSTTGEALPAAAPPSVKAPAYDINDVRGRSTDQLGRMFAPTQERVAQCVPGTSGVVKIRVENKNNKTVLSIEPDVALDVKTRRCILEALSMVQLDEDATKRLGPPGFTSHVIIRW